MLHNGFIPNHFNPSLQMSKGRHKGKIQLSTGLPIHSVSNEKLFLKKIKTKLIFSRLAKTLSAVLQLNIFEDRHSTISTVVKNRQRREEKGVKGEWGGEGHIYIPRSSTRTSGHEMQKK